MKRYLALGLCIFVLALSPVDVDRVKASDVNAAGSQALSATVHPPVSRDASALWLAPTSADLRLAATRPFVQFKNAVQALEGGHATESLRLLMPLVEDPASAVAPLDDYVNYYAALADFSLNNFDRARKRLDDLRDPSLQGYLTQAAALVEAEAAEAQSDYDAAAKIYERLSHEKTSNPDEIWMQLGHAAASAGDRVRATEAFTRVYYEFPFSDLSADARAQLDRIDALEPLAPQNARYRLDLGRAERLFAARRYPEAQAAFESLKRYAVAGDRDLVSLRLAEIDFFRNRNRIARESLRGLTEQGPRRAEAMYFYSRVLDELNLPIDFIRIAREIVDQFPDSPWAEDALNDLATYYIKQDDTATGDLVLRELYSKFPAGRYAPRAAWKIGWLSYRSGRYAEATNYFDATARQYPRSDYRPMFLYWSGRAFDAVGDRTTANARYTLASTDYLNTYYGRLAAKQLIQRGDGIPFTGLQFASSTTPAREEDAPQLVPTAAVIRALLALGLYPQALNELRYAQRIWGETPVTLATMAWIDSQQGNYRDATVAMKRAYPQYMAAGGELLPDALLRVIFPVDYWDEIRALATRHGLNPYLLAALVGQESAFDAKIKSSANAVGLMQLLPSTGRIYARRLKMGRFSRSMLTNAKTNLTMGSAYFADLVNKWGKPYLALAAYNAGDSRVARWLAERQGDDLDQDEFIDDIPFPETQNYIKKILSTTEDYRRLYGESSRSTESQ